MSMGESSDHTGSGTVVEAVRTAPVRCILCERDDTEFLFEAWDRLHGGVGVFRYVRCRGCGLVYMNPQVVAEDLGRLYPADYGPHQAKHKKQQRSRRSFQAELNRMPFVSLLCAGLTAHSRVLDLGCGRGSFLHKVRAVTGCMVQGVDNSQEAGRTAGETYGIEVFVGTILEAPFPAESFDAVTVWWCLEHVPSPLPVLCKVHELLRPGGSCILAVPNSASFNARVFRDRWYHLDCPRHLYLYCPDTISKLVRKSGLVVKAIAFDKGPRGLIQSLRYQFGDDAVPMKLRGNLAGMRLLKALATPWTAFLALCGQADQMVVHARKPQALRP